VRQIPKENKMSFDLAQDDGAKKKRPRHYHEGAEGLVVGEGAVVKPAVTDASFLYRHALESVFAFLSLAELSFAMVVSKSWLVAVEKMRGIGAQLGRTELLTNACFSRLARHIGTIGRDDDSDPDKPLDATPERLALCFSHLSGLHTMICQLPYYNKVELMLFPPSLTSLYVRVDNVRDLQNNYRKTLDEEIATISRLPLLSSLSIHLNGNLSGIAGREECEVDLSHFQRCPLLKSLMVFSYKSKGRFAGTPTNIEQIRAMPHLTDLLESSFSDQEWMQLLRSPHQLRLERMKLSRRPPKELLELMVVSLPELTHLDTPLAVGLSVLAATPNLRSLTLSAEYKSSERDIIVSPDQMIADVGMCEKLHTLRVTAWGKPITSAHMQRILSRMPNLSELCMLDASRLDSLEFLSATKPLAHTLRSLRMKHCDFSGEQVRLHIYTLQQLVYLHLDGECLDDLEDETRSHLRPPSYIFRKLQQSYVGGGGEKIKL